ncbi:hypothetical protein CRUP_010289, partial [Coryphaenoides rupestris]
RPWPADRGRAARRSSPAAASDASPRSCSATSSTTAAETRGRTSRTVTFPTEMYAGRKQTHAARTQSVIKQMLMPSAIVRRASRGTKRPASAKKSTSVSSLTRAHTIARTRKDLLNVRAIGTIKRSTATVWQK